MFYPDTTSTSQLFQTLLKQLTRTGWSIDVYCGYPTDSRLRHLPRIDNLHGITIYRCGSRLPLKRNFLFRTICYATFLIAVLFRLLFVDSRATWLGVTNPPFNVQVLAICSWLRKHSFSYFLLDLHPEGLLATDSLNKNNPLVKFWLFLNGLSYRRAKSLFILGRDMRALLNQNYRTSDQIVHYMPHWSPIEPFRVKHFDESRLTQQWGLLETFVVQYSGNMGLWHDMNSFVRLADSFREDSSTRFLFIGDGVRKPDAEALATTLQLDNIYWKPFVPLEDLEESLAACHVALISLRNDLSGIAVPCKLYGILASGRPIIAQVPHDSEIAITVTEFECGFVVPPGDDLQLIQSLNQLKTDSRLREEMGRNSRAAYVSHFTCRSVVERLEQLL